MRRTNIYLDDEQCEALDEVASQRGVSRAAVIRRLIDDGLQTMEPTVDEDVASTEATFGAAPGIVPLERGDDARAQHLRRIAASDS